ncbi:MAG: enolase C-terminal domain-like protein [Rubrivivax sp.]
MSDREPKAAVEGLRIDEIEIVLLDSMPKLKRRIPTGELAFGGSKSPVGKPVLVRVRAGGLFGWASLRPANPYQGDTAAACYSALRDFYAPKLIGQDASRIVGLLRQCENMLPDNPVPLAVLDMALHDLVGRAAGVPVHTLLGGACCDRIPMEWSIGLADEETMIREAVNAVEKLRVPYLCVKVGPSPRLADDVRAVTRIRKAVGPDIKLGMDANTSYDLVAATQLLERLEEVGITYFEQPMPVRAVRDIAVLRSRARCAIMADESVYGIADAINLAAGDAFDVLAHKFIKSGGFRRGREIAAIADAVGRGMNSAGTANGTYIEAVAAAHLCAAVPNHVFGAEFVMGLPEVDRDPLVQNTPVRLQDGHANVPKLPGLGAELDEAELQRIAISREVFR